MGLSDSKLIKFRLDPASPCSAAQYERMAALASMSDENIDYSDIPPLDAAKLTKRTNMSKTFAERIEMMNSMYRLPINTKPTLPENTADRLKKFKATLMDEVHEIDEIVALAEGGAQAIDIQVAIADLLGDVIVYCRSEALKYGIPLEAVLDVIMDSNESKLGADGNPIYDANGKFLKGPNYWKPEPKIKALLESK